MQLYRPMHQIIDPSLSRARKSGYGAAQLPKQAWSQAQLFIALSCNLSRTISPPHPHLYQHTHEHGEGVSPKEMIANTAKAESERGILDQRRGGAQVVPSGLRAPNGTIVERYSHLGRCGT